MLEGGRGTLPGYLDHIAYSHCLVVMRVLLYEFSEAWVGVVLEVRHGWLLIADNNFRSCLYCIIDSRLITFRLIH